MIHFRSHLLPLVLLLRCLSSINASDADSVSHLQIHIPKGMFREKGYEHKEALFGIPPYGGSITQNVYYANSDLCDSNVNTRIGYPKRSTDASGKQMPWPSPYILMVDRGGCTFVTKVRNGQRSGAAGVIIADNSCLCTAGDTCTNEGFDCEENEPIMADDGSGSDISIPSFLMYKQDADVIRDTLMADQMIQIQMSWSLPRPDDRVEYSLWTTPMETISRGFEQTFASAALALGESAYFTPHMYIYDGIKSNCQGADGQNQCANLCTNSGRYCSTDPDNDLEGGISGADIVQESLRRICIWTVYGQEDGIGKNWWIYINDFYNNCVANPQFFKDDRCIEHAFAQASIDSSKIDRCIKESGGLKGDTINSLLEDELLSKDIAGVVVLPAVYVNRAPLRGGIEFETVFGAVCSGFAAGTAPKVCKKCQLCPTQQQCTIHGNCRPKGNGDAVSNQTFIMSLAGVSLVFLFIGIIQYKRSQTLVRNQVKGIMAEYMPLDEENDINTAIDAETELPAATID